MSPQQLRTGLQYAAWIILVSVALLPFLGRETPEFFITSLSLIIGLLFALLLVIWGRRSFR